MLSVEGAPGLAALLCTAVCGSDAADAAVSVESWVPHCTFWPCLGLLSLGERGSCAPQHPNLFFGGLPGAKKEGSRKSRD